MTGRQREALALLRRSREADPSTDDGLVSNTATFYDVEVDVAWVHWRTAAALEKLGLVVWGDYDPDGTELRLTEKGAGGVSDELRPVFRLVLELDGDDYTPTSTPEARDAVEEALQSVVNTGVIRGFELRPRDEPF